MFNIDISIEKNSDQNEPQIIKQIKDFNSTWRTYLKNPKLDEALIRNASQLVAELISKAEVELNNLKASIFDYKTCEFKINSETIRDGVIGEIVIKSSKPKKMEDMVGK